MKTSVLFCLSILVPALSLPTRADVLVLTDGSRIQTRGPWQVESRRILYSDPGGTLTALRLSNVDLEASRRATEAEKRPATPAPKARVDTRPTALVLEDGDVGRSRGRVMSLEALFASGHRLADELWALGSAYDMGTAAGVTRSLPSLEALAYRWRQQAERATGAESVESSTAAATVEALADLARDDPERLAGLWPKKPPGETSG